MKRFVILGLFPMLLTGCQTALDVMSATNNVLGSVNSVLSGGSSSSGSTGEGSVYIDNIAKSTAKSATEKAKANAQTRALFQSARPTIEKVVSLAACGVKGSQMQRYTDPDFAEARYSFHTPFSELRYHKSGCLSVLRISNITKVSANAIRFKVDFLSPQSEEGVQKEYTAIKQPDGEWLFKWY